MGDTVHAELTTQAKTALKQISTFLLCVKCSHNYYISGSRTIQYYVHKAYSWHDKKRDKSLM